jgi:hypothetical protein
MQHYIGFSYTAAVATGFALATAPTATLTAADAGIAAAAVPLETSTMIIEYNASARDIGVQFFIDSEGWQAVRIFDPRGVEIFNAETGGRLTRQGGGTELFLESVEPELAELSLRTFFNRFPAGIYTFKARDVDGNLQVGSARFSHRLPAGPVLITPVPSGDAECANKVPIPVTVAWEPVTTSTFGLPINIVGYEVIVENDADVTLDFKFPADVLQLTVPDGLLKPGADYIFEVLAVAEGGNQTITEGCFSTAK